MGKTKIILGTLVVVAIGVGLWAFWRHGTLYPATQDAYVQAHVLTVTAEVRGRVIAVNATENQKVKAGDVLFELDGALYENAVTQAKASLQSAREAEASFATRIKAASAAIKSAQSADDAAQAQLGRVKTLLDRGDAAQATLDQTKSAAAQTTAALNAANAQLAQARSALVTNRDASIAAQAQLQTAQTNLARVKVTAPVDGWVANFALREGSVVTAYAPLFSIIDDSEWWVEANFKETDLPRITSGQPVTVSIDLLPGQSLSGQVASIGFGSGSTFSLLPAENASGNWVKVTQRFAVRIALDPTELPLRVGASASVTVDTTAE